MLPTTRWILCAGALLFPCSLHAQSAEPDAAGSASASPEENHSPARVVLRVQSGVPLDAARTRDSIASELAVPVVVDAHGAMPADTGYLTVRVLPDGSVELTYRAPDGHEIQRVITAPGHDESLRAAIALLAGNMVRDQTREVLDLIAAHTIAPSDAPIQPSPVPRGAVASTTPLRVDAPVAPLPFRLGVEAYPIAGFTIGSQGSLHAIVGGQAGLWLGDRWRVGVTGFTTFGDSEYAIPSSAVPPQPSIKLATAHPFGGTLDGTWVPFAGPRFGTTGRHRWELQVQGGVGLMVEQIRSLVDPTVRSFAPQVVALGHAAVAFRAYPSEWLGIGLAVDGYCFVDQTEDAAIGVDGFVTPAGVPLQGTRVDPATWNGAAPLIAWLGVHLEVALRAW